MSSGSRRIDLAQVVDQVVLPEDTLAADGDVEVLHVDAHVAQ